MKRAYIKNWTRYFLGMAAVSGMLIFSSCGEDTRREPLAEDRGYGVDNTAADAGITGAEGYDRTSNTAAQRNYDVASMGTAAENRQEMEAAGENLSDQDYKRLRQEYDEVNTQLRDNYRQNPGLSVRYTDDNRTADYSYGYYGVYYDNVNNNETRSQLSQLEQRRLDLRNQMRGKMDKERQAYLAAEMDAVPKQGYDKLYEEMQNEVNTGQQGPSDNPRGMVLVEFVVDKSGNVTNPTAIEVIEVQANNAGTTGTNPQTNNETQKQLEQQALKAVKATSGKWEPAQMDGKPVAVVVQLPVPINMDNGMSGTNSNQNNTGAGSTSPEQGKQ